MPLLPTTPRVTSLESERGGLGDLQKLPPEVIQEAVDSLADEPHALAGFAATTKLATEFTNRSLKDLVPPTHQTTSNRLGEWTAQFRTLAPPIRRALKATAGLLPCPDIFSPIDDNVQGLHIQLAAARQRASRGIITGQADSMVNALYYAKQFAEKAGVPMPDTADIEREGYTKAGIQVPAVSSPQSAAWTEMFAALSVRSF